MMNNYIKDNLPSPGLVLGFKSLVGSCNFFLFLLHFGLSLLPEKRVKAVFVEARFDEDRDQVIGGQRVRVVLVSGMPAPSQLGSGNVSSFV